MTDAQIIEQPTLPADIQKAITTAFEDLREKAWSNEEKLTKAKIDENQPKSWFADPFALLDSVGMGYRNAPTYLTYDTLRQVAERDTYVSSIILTRIDQVAAFARPQPNKYSVGFKIQPRHGDKKRLLTESERERCEEIQMIILNTGREYNLGRDGFRQFIAKFVRDSLTYDQACHPAGTMVHLANGGAVPIDELKVGMRVWTHRGRVRRVEKVTRRSFTGEMYRVTSGGQSIVCTEGHPLFAEANHWLNIQKYKERGFEPKWIGPEELKVGAYLTSPWLTPEVEETPEVPSWGKLDPTLAILLGLYTAEGHEQGGALTLTFHSDEEDLVEFVEAQAKYAGHTTARVEYKDRNAIGVRINRGDDGQLTAWFVESCGRGSNNKRVPPFILRAPREVRLGFLFGYLLGDGTCRPGGASFTTTSQALFHGIRALLAMERVYARQNIRDFSAYGWAEQYQANLSGSRWRAVAKELDFPQATLPTREPHVVDDSYAYLKISKVEHWSVVDEPVFNCEVDEDHSYIANGFSSHNCFECVRTRGGSVFSFNAVPSDTIRTSTPKQLKGTPPKVNELRKDIRYVQVINSSITAEFTIDEMAFMVRNPRSHVKTYGYGMPEIEMLMSTITSHLWAEEWNRKMFCVAPGTLVKTNVGIVAIEELVDPTTFEAWTGTRWVPAQAFASGRKPLVRTLLWNGLELETSPEHRFLVVPSESETGVPEWRQQKALKSGDTLLVDPTPSDVKLNEDAFFVDTSYDSSRKWGHEWKVTGDVVRDEAFWEFIGFAIGDGYWPQLGARTAAGHRAPQWMRVAYHYENDLEVRQRHFETLVKHGVNAKLYTDGKGCRIDISHRAFFEWLYELGFSPSTTTGKTIASVVYRQPRWLRCAILRGWFSADGHRHMHAKGYATPTLKAVDRRLRQHALRLLWSVGVAANDVGTGWDRAGDINVRDVIGFMEHIRYAQDYKNEDVVRERRAATSWDVVHDSTLASLVGLVKGSERWLTLSRSDRDMVCKADRGLTRISRPRLISLLTAVGVDVPEVLRFHHVQVDQLDREPISEVEMYDVEVFGEDHRFVANGVVVHNSQGSTVKGVLNVKGNIPPVQFEAFKRMWHSQVAGVQNAWKTPMLNSEEIQWLPLQLSNTEMGYQMWMEYLVKITCALFRIDPAEINFDLRGGVGQQPVFMSTNEAQQKASKDRGLQPLMHFMEDTLNRHVVWKIDPRFELVFAGLDAKTEEQAQQLRMQQVQNTHTLNEVRAMDDLPPVQYGDNVMNATYIGYKMQKEQTEQMAQMAQQQAGQPQPGGQAGQPGQEPPPPRFSQAPGDEEQHGADQLRQFAEPNAPAPGGAPAAAGGGEDDESSGPTPEVLSRLHIDDWDSSFHHSLRSDDLKKAELFDTIDLD